MYETLEQTSVRIVLFLLISAVLVWLSRKPLQNKQSHGYYRFFSWECTAALIVLNLPVWETQPDSPHQLCSMLFMILSVVLVASGTYALKRYGQANQARQDEALYGFERTTQLVTQGIFHTIRHPMYSSLILLTWGAWLQNPQWLTVPLAIISTYLLWLTAKADERECTAFFGSAYTSYMQRTKRFIPFVF